MVCVRLRLVVFKAFRFAWLSLKVCSMGFEGTLLFRGLIWTGTLVSSRDGPSLEALRSWSRSLFA